MSKRPDPRVTGHDGFSRPPGAERVDVWIIEDGERIAMAGFDALDPGTDARELVDRIVDQTDLELEVRK